MTRGIAWVVAVGCAVAMATAQTKTAVYIVFPQFTAVTPGSAISITVMVGYIPGTGAPISSGGLSGNVIGLAHGRFSICGGAGMWSNPTLLPPFNAAGSSAGVADGAGVTGIVWNYGDLEPPGPHLSFQINPHPVWRATYTHHSGYGNFPISISDVSFVGVFAGEGWSGGSGTTQPFVALYSGDPGAGGGVLLPPLSTCYADCDHNTTLTVADFVCFQTKFLARDGYANCDGNCYFTVADFGCFQTKFVLGGCP